MTHPEDLLADYVDGTLSPDELARVEQHLASCPACAEEVSLARAAVTAVASLPEEPAPFGIAQRALREGAQRRSSPRPTAWKLAGAAAAAAVIAGAFVLLGGRETAERNASPSLAGGGAEGADAPASESTVRSEDQTVAGSAAEAYAPRPEHPVYAKVQANYTSETLDMRTIEIADEARLALDQGFPPNAQLFYASFSLDSLPKPAQVALACVNEGVPPDRTVVPFVIEDARFEDTPAHLVTYLRGQTAAEPYDRLQLLVASRETCSILHFARQRL